MECVCGDDICIPTEKHVVPYSFTRVVSPGYLELYMCFLCKRYLHKRCIQQMISLRCPYCRERMAVDKFTKRCVKNNKRHMSDNTYITVDMSAIIRPEGVWSGGLGVSIIEFRPIPISQRFSYIFYDDLIDNTQSLSDSTPRIHSLMAQLYEYRNLGFSQTLEEKDTQVGLAIQPYKKSNIVPADLGLPSGINFEVLYRDSDSMFIRIV